MERQKVALVTGASRGIGLAIAIQRGLDGFQIAAVATREEQYYPEAAARLEKAGVDYRWFAGNIGSGEDRKRIVAQVVAAFGRIDVLVNNAGVAPNVRADLLDMSEESYDRVMEINAKGTMFMTQAVARQMMAQERQGAKRGTIINVSSCSCEVVSLNRGEYCISKAGISMVTKLFAARLAPESILVFEVRPGVIATDMTSAVEDKYNHLIETGVFPIARWGKPEDVADAVSVFAGDKFLYSTGSYIDVDGGFHIRQL